MVKPIKQIGLRECIELSEVANHSCHGIDLATQCYLHRVVVAVTMRVVAFAEDGEVMRSIVSVCM
jgi:hypothetical protein